MVVYLILVFIICLCVFLKMKTKIQSDLEPPMISGWITVVGHSFKFIGNSVQFLKSVLKLTDESVEKGGIVTCYLGPRKVYVVADPDDSVTIMNSCLKRHMFFDFSKPLLGEGLLTANVPTWRKHRKLLNPAFNQQILDGFIGVFNSQAEKLVNLFALEVGKPFDQEILLRVNNLETICSTSFGVYTDGSEYDEIIKQYLPRVMNIMKLIMDRIQKFWLYSDYIYNMTTAKRQLDEEKRYMTVLSKLYSASGWIHTAEAFAGCVSGKVGGQVDSAGTITAIDIIQKKKSQRKDLSNPTSGFEKFKSFMDLLLELADETNCFNDKQIQWETETVIGAGHDTTATTLTFALAVLGSHADVQEKAYKEIQEVLGESIIRITKQDLGKLIYIESILKEVMRLYIITSVLARCIEKDIKLKNYTLKANSDCFIMLTAIHRNKALWGPDADQFRPERWLEKETLPNAKYYAAFGLGKRSCIGKSYAMMLMKIYLIYIVRKYHISSDISKMVMEMPVLIRPHSGHYITLSFRIM